jgi:hypothetical protein
MSIASDRPTIVSDNLGVIEVRKNTTYDEFNKIIKEGQRREREFVQAGGEKTRKQRTFEFSSPPSDGINANELVVRAYGYVHEGVFLSVDPELLLKAFNHLAIYQAPSPSSAEKILRTHFRL